MARTAMPEAAVDEKCNALITKNEVGPARQRLMTTPSSQAVRAKKSDHRKFGLFVTARTHQAARSYSFG